jgi:flagellar biosynthesis chaperone FliJ
MSSSEVTITLTAVDDASEVVYSAASNIDEADTQISESTQEVSAATQQTSISTQQTAMGFNNLALSGMSLWMAVNNVENAQVALDRAHLQVEKATNAVTAAQLAYNTACEKYGPNSKEAQDALAKLQTAQDALTVAQERAGEAQRNYDNTIMFSAMTIIPSLITAFTSITKIGPAVDTAIGGMSDAMDFLAANPIVLVIAGIAALVAGLIFAYENCKPFRDAVNDIGAALGGTILTAANDLRDALNFLWNNVLVPIADFLEKVFLKAIDDVVGAIKPFQTAVSDVSGVAGDLSKGVSDLGGALSHLCFVHAAPAAEIFNKTLKESIDLTDALTGKTNSLASSLFSVSGSVGGPGGVGGGGGIGAAAALAAGGRGPMINITAPLVQIQGSADKATAQMAAHLVQQSLKNVTVEPTSHGTWAEHKRILLGYNK